MAKKRLILHIGMHKTGTSAVQRYFSRNRVMLRRMGVCYPRSIGPDGQRQPKHNAIFAAISHEADFGTPHPVLGPSRDVIAAAADEIDAVPGKIGVISAEGLSGERSVFAEKMAPLRDRFDVTVVIFLRRQDHWVESFYKQMVLSREVRETRSFHDFLQAPSTRAHMSFDRIVGWWASRFGAENTLVQGYHPTGPRRPLFRVLEAAGMPRQFRWLPFADAKENRSAGVDAVEVVRRCNEMGLDAPRDAADMIEARFGHSSQRYMTEEERIALLNGFGVGNQKLVERLNPLDRACLGPNKAELGQSRELRWEGRISAQFSSNSIALFRLNH